MKGKIFLAGGGSRETSFKIDEIFFEGVNKILYIPWAWRDDNFDGCLKWFNEMLEKHDKKIDVKLWALDEIVNFEDYDAIYIGGGNTFKLLKRLKEKGFNKSFRDFYESGKKIYGGSAGAIIWGTDIELALKCSHPDENKVGLQDTSGFNILEGCDVQPHWEDSDLKVNLEYVNETGRNVIGIPEESAVIVSENGYEVIGDRSVVLISDEGIKNFSTGEFLELK